MMRKDKRFPITRFKIPLFYLIFFAIILFQLGQPSHAKPAQSNKGRSKRVPAVLLKWPEQGSPYAVLVDKSRQKVLLYHRDKPFQPVKTYPASTGENDGPKSKMNDRKTPEGIYFFTDSFVDRELAPIYGVRAFPIDYPNPIDKTEGKGGYGIWFHGLDKPLKPTDTNGCIAMDNPNIDDLASYIKLDETPVIISQQIKMVDYEEMKKEARELEQTVDDWRTAWAEKEIDRYMSFYTGRFYSGAKNWKQYRAYKARLARNYKNIEVNIKNLRLVKADGLVVATFDQDYSTERFRSLGKKKLYFQQNSKQWKITREVFTLVKRERVIPPKAPPFNPQEIRDLIFAWKSAWENKDLNKYLSAYDPNFRSRGMNLKAWKKHRERLNHKYHSIQVGIQDLIILKGPSNTIKVSFKQYYQADAYHDFGLKKINLVKKGKHWKIKSEEWLPMDRKSLL
jgi:murein L,D-transpeptidase YafK